MATTGTRACRACSQPLRADNDPNFTRTVFAESTHECARATKVTLEAARGAAMFAMRHDFVHARLINPGVTVESWTHLLQELTTTHDLAHRVIDVGQGKKDYPMIVVTTRVAYVPDMKQVLAELLRQMHDAWPDLKGKPSTDGEPQVDTLTTQVMHSPSEMRKFAATLQQQPDRPAGNRAERRRRKTGG